jgi:hypothetical protein
MDRGTDWGIEHGPEHGLGPGLEQGAGRPVPRVPGYELGELLGQGATGRVWAATRVDDGARVAVKVVSVSGDDDADRVARELSVLATTAVEGVVGFRESVGLDDPPAVAIILDLARGGSLARAVGARGHLSVGEAVTVLAPVAKALAGLHAAGVVHGDVSPGNVLLELSGRPLLADVGVATVLGERPGEVFGTDGFVAPEVAVGAAPTSASDVYAVGALAWWCVTGAPPEPAALRRPLAQIEPGLPAAFLELTVQAMSSDPGQRPDAAVLALGYFDAAQCAPLRLVVGSDETSLLTRRLRESADRALGVEPASSRHEDRGRDRVGRRWRGRPTRRGSAAADASATGVAPEVVEAAPAGRHARRRAERSVVRAGARRRDVGRGVAGAMVVGVPLVVMAVMTGLPTWPDLPWAPDGSAVSDDRRGPVAVNTPSTPGPSTLSSPSSTGDVATDRGAPSRDPVGLMQSLADQRARVMNTGSASSLAVLDAPGSAAMTADESLVRALAAAGERYRDVRLSVRSARLLSPSGAVRGDTVAVEAVIDTSAHVLVDRSGRDTLRGAATGSPMVFTLRWADGRWRVASVDGTAG